MVDKGDGLATKRSGQNRKSKKAGKGEETRLQGIAGQKDFFSWRRNFERFGAGRANHYGSWGGGPAAMDSLEWCGQGGKGTALARGYAGTLA